MCCLCCLATRVSADRANILEVSSYVVRFACVLTVSQEPKNFEHVRERERERVILIV